MLFLSKFEDKIRIGIILVGIIFYNDKKGNKKEMIFVLYLYKINIR